MITTKKACRESKLQTEKTQHEDKVKVNFKFNVFRYSDLFLRVEIWANEWNFATVLIPKWIWQDLTTRKKFAEEAYTIFLEKLKRRCNEGI